MPCQLNKTKEGKIESILTEGGKPSELYPQLQTLVGDDYLAAKLYFATQTDSFKNAYNGIFNAVGEPILSSANINQKPVYIFADKANKPIMTIATGKSLSAFNERENLLPIAEGMRQYAPLFDDTPLSNAQQTVWVQNKDYMMKMSARYRSVVDQIARNQERWKLNGRPNLPNGDPYHGTGFNDNGIAQYLKEGFTATDWDRTKTYGENKAEKIFIDDKGNPLPKDEKKMIIDEQGNSKLLTKAEYITEKNLNAAYGTLNGNIRHKYDQWIHASTLERIGIEADIAKLLVQAKADGLEVSDSHLAWMKTIAPFILGREGINDETVVLHEQRFISDTLGITGAIDKMILYPDGYMSLREIKTSSRIKQSRSIDLFKYGYKEYLEANPLNEAKVQLMFYALSLAIDNPLIKYTNLGIDLYTSEWASKTEGNRLDLSRQDIERILSMIKYMFQEESKNNGPLAYVWQNLQDLEKTKPGTIARVFGSNIYSNTPSFSTETKTVAGKVEKKAVYGENTVESALKAVDDLKMGLGMYYNMDEFKNKAYNQQIASIKKQYESVHDNIHKFVSIMSGQGLSNDPWTKDISYLNFIVGGTTSNVRNSLAAVYNEHFHTQFNKSKKTFHQETDQMYQYLLPVFNKYLLKNNPSAKPITRLDQKIYGIFMQQDFMKNNIHKMWEEVFWTESMVEGQKIAHRRRADQFDQNNQKEEIALTKFLDAYYEKWLGTEDSFINKNATYRLKPDDSLEVITHLDVLNGKSNGSKNGWGKWNYKEMITKKDAKDNTKDVYIPFTPAIPLTPYEYEERLKDNGYKTPIWKKYFLNYFTDYLDKNIKQEQEEETLFVPMKYLGHVGQSGQDQSKNLAVAFEAFAENMNNKLYLDDSIAVGEAMALHLEKINGERDETERVRNLITFIRNLSRYQGKGALPKDDFIRNARKTTGDLFRIPIKHRVANGKDVRDVEYIVTLHTLLSGLRSTAAHVIMTLSPIGGLYNSIQAVFSSSKAASNFGVGKYLLKGSTDEAHDFSFNDYWKGIAVWKKGQESALGGTDPESAKLYLIARDIAYLSRNSEYQERMKNDLFAPYKFLNSSSLMFMHTMAEEMNTMAILYAQLKHIKVKTTDKNGKEHLVSMWDAYEVKSTTENGVTKHEAVYKHDELGSRGVEKVGDSYIPVYGLTTKEVVKLKRVYERLQGNYRKEERSFIELYSLGQVAMQFKRFLPSLIRNQFQGRRADRSLGKYQIIKDENGNELLDWKERMVAGKYYVLFNYFMGGILAPIMKKIPQNFKNKASFEFRGDYRWSEMEADEQIQVVDAITTMALMFLFTIGSWKKADDDGQKDTVATIITKLGETMTQPWSLVQTLNAIKNFSPIGVSGGLALNQMNAMIEMFAAEGKYLSGITDSPYNEDGNLPGFKKMIRNLPLGRAISDIRNMKENFNEGAFISGR